MATTPQTMHKKRKNASGAQSTYVQPEYVPGETWTYQRVQANQCMEFYKHDSALSKSQFRSLSYDLMNNISFE